MAKNTSTQKKRFRDVKQGKAVVEKPVTAKKVKKTVLISDIRNSISEIRNKFKCFKSQIQNILEFEKFEY